MILGVCVVIEVVSYKYRTNQCHTDWNCECLSGLFLDILNFKNQMTTIQMMIQSRGCVVLYS